MAQAPITQDEQRVKQRTMPRLAIALALIAAAIVGLALLDRYNASLKERAPPAPPPQQPALEGPPPPVIAPLPPTAQTPPSEESQSAAPPPPVVSNPPVAPVEPLPKPSIPATPSPAPAAQPPAATASPPAPATSAVPQSQPPAAPSASKDAVPRAPAPQVQPAPSSKGFVVQVGVFSSPANAQALQRRLAQEGIPAQVETRVVVGPFADRPQAEGMIQRLKEIGMGGVVVAPPAPPAQ
jgi:DedD protein